MAGAGEVLKDVWPLERGTLTKRNNVRLRRWGMWVYVTDDPTPANNTAWILVNGLVDNNRNNNANWQKLAEYVSVNPFGSPVTSLHTDLTEVDNTGGVETTIASYVLPANSLDANNKSIHGFFIGSVLGTPNIKRLKVKFGGDVLFDSEDFVDFDGNAFVLEFQIVRVNANAQKCWGRLATGLSSKNASYAALTKDLTTNLTVALTATATDDEEIVNQMTKIFMEPA